MRLAFDLDGVLADMRTSLQREALRLFPDADVDSLSMAASPVRAEADSVASDNVDDEPAPGMRVPALSSRQQRELWRSVCGIPNYWETLEEIEPGTVARIAALSRECGWEVLFITNRPTTAGDTVQAQTQRWLARHGFELPSVMVLKGSRGKVADALDLDVVVDDRPDNCLDVVLESRARAILVWRDEDVAVPRRAKRMEIGSVTTMAACLDLLVEADRAGQPASVMGRLRRLLGLKPAQPLTPPRR